MKEGVSIAKSRYKERKEKEVAENFKAFRRLQKKHGNEMTQHSNQYALMRDKKIEGYFDTWEAAIQAGRERHEDNIFSIQAVNEPVVDLGFMSHVLF